MKTLLFAVMVAWLILATAQDRSELETLPEADRTVAGAYHEWITGEIKSPPVLCLYGTRTGPRGALLTAARIFDDDCPKAVGDDPLFGLAYFLPPAHDSRLARAYFGDAACIIADNVTVAVGAAPTLIVLVYMANVLGGVRYMYCVTEDDGLSQTWY